MLSIFLWAYLTPVYLLWTISLSLMPVFNWVVSSLLSFDNTSPFIRSVFCMYTNTLILCHVFSFSQSCLFKSQSFPFWWTAINLFLYWLCFSLCIKENLTHSHKKRVLLPCRLLLAKISRSELNRRSENGHHYHVLDLRRKSSVFYHSVWYKL